MDWYQIGALIGVNITLLGLLATLIIWMIGKLDADVKSINTDVKSLASRMDGHAVRIDQLYQQFQNAITVQNSRSDKLYQMFIDLLKENKRT